MGWVHLYEPHFPYSPAEPFASRFPQSAYLETYTQTMRELEKRVGEIRSATGFVKT